VNVSWTASSGTPAPTGYYVVRIDASNNSSPACNTSPTTTIVASLCTDALVAVGTYTYKVTAVYHSWTAISTSSASISVAQSTQTITFTSTAPSNASVGGSSYPVTATGGGSGNPVTFTIDAASTPTCSMTGSVVSFTAAGTCTIDANQAGNAMYLAAGQAQQSFAVGKNDQTITFASTAPAGATVGGPTYNVTATGGASASPVTFTIDPATDRKR